MLPFFVPRRPTAPRPVGALAGARAPRDQRALTCASAGPGPARETSTITVVNDPRPEVLQKLGVNRWPTWGCGVSEFDWSYDQQETAYILEGSAVVIPKDGQGKEAIIAKGDLVIFPKGLECVWRVLTPINKHYNFS
jgi:uncharacterized protein